MDSQPLSANDSQALNAIVALAGSRSSQTGAKVSSDESAFRDLIAHLTPENRGSADAENLTPVKPHEKSVGKNLKADDPEKAKESSDQQILVPVLAAISPATPAQLGTGDVKNAGPVVASDDIRREGAEITENDIKAFTDAVVPVTTLDTDASLKAVDTANVPEQVPQSKAARVDDVQESRADQPPDSDETKTGDASVPPRHLSTFKNAKSISRTFHTAPSQNVPAQKYEALGVKGSSIVRDVEGSRTSRKTAPENSPVDPQPLQTPIEAVHENASADPATKEAVIQISEPKSSPAAVHAVQPSISPIVSDIPPSSSTIEARQPAVSTAAPASIPQIQTADLMHRGEKAELKVELKTPELGHVQVTAALRDETVHATVKVESSDVREMITSAIGRNDDPINRHEVKVQAFDAASSTGSGSSQSQQERPAHPAHRTAEQSHWRETPRAMIPRIHYAHVSERAVDLHA